MKLKLAIIGLALPAICFSQSNRIVAAQGRIMSSTDSLMVKQLYFTALREKTIENASLATELFTRILQIDPKKRCCHVRACQPQKGG